MSTTPSPNSRPATLRPPVEPTFDQELCGLVLDTAPRLFAVVQVCGENADGWVAAWGLADSDGRSHVISINGRTRMTLPSPERAVRHFSGRPGITARLIWLSPPKAATVSRAAAA
ncbi:MULTISPECIES: hypothetical protein [Streptomycetaceae]|uniref:hypothetical protein n=1 Tax=Streptomycetaceae TaxID=2062 RepID=UPI00093BA738|nr:hypothetical protein [Streptomyces sp. CB02056]OKI07777.1 hypothetical protein AMK13_14745 [Streptomyces sp. CB02056]